MNGRRLIWRLTPALMGVFVPAMILALIAHQNGWPVLPALGLGLGLGFAGVLVVLRSFSGKLLRQVESATRAMDLALEGQLDARATVDQDEDYLDLASHLNPLMNQLQRTVSRLESRIAEQDAVLNSMVEGVLAVDMTGRVISINPAAGGLLSADPESVVGRPLQEVFRNADLARFVTSVLSGYRIAEADIVLRSGQELLLQARGTTLRNPVGQGIGAVLVLNDVTRLRQLENMRRDFAANVSHELRTPITAIKGFVETLLDGALHQVSDSERFLRIVARQTDRLNDIIEDLMALSKIEREGETGEIKLESCSLRGVLDSVAADCAQKAEDRDVKIELECPRDLQAKINPPLLRQAVLNLIDNAIKFSEPGSNVALWGAKNGENVIIGVRDQGCGIAAEHLPRIFERFYRADKARSRKLGGTGLGLAIVKHIVSAHRGQISVDSQIGRGSEFTIHIPLDHSPADAT